MKTEDHTLFVNSPHAPTVEVDTEASAIYVRFKHAKVAKTIPRPSKSMIIAIDVDSKNEVIGIECVGVKEFGIAKIINLLKQASVKAPKVDLNKMRYIPAALAHA